MSKRTYLDQIKMWRNPRYTQRMRDSVNEQRHIQEEGCCLWLRADRIIKMSTDYHTAQGDFTSIVFRLQPMVLSNFVMWLDLKVAEFKVYGQMLLGKSKWRPNGGTLLLLTYFRLFAPLFWTEDEIYIYTFSSCHRAAPFSTLTITK